MKKIIAAILFICSACVVAGDLPDLGEPTLGRYELSKGQIAAETAFAVLWYADYTQTKQINGWCDRNTEWRGAATVVTHHDDGTVTSNNGGRCDVHESNPLLGKHPSDAKIRNYFLGVGVAHVLITKALPSEYRPVWQGVGIGLELWQVIANKRFGVSWKFN